ARNGGAQAPFAVYFVGFEAGAIGLDEGATDEIVLVFNLRPDHGDVGNVARGDPHLFAVEDVFVADFAGGGCHAAGVGAEAGFGQSEAAEFFAFGESGQPGVLLFIGTEGVNGIHDESGLHADKTAETRVAAFQFLHDEAVFDVGHAGAAVALEIGAEEAELAHYGYKFARKALGAKTPFDDGNEVVFNKIACRAADEKFVFTEAGVEIKEVEALKFETHDCTCRSESSSNKQG